MSKKKSPLVVTTSVKTSYSWHARLIVQFHLATEAVGQNICLLAYHNNINPLASITKLEELNVHIT